MRYQYWRDGEPMPVDEPFTIDVAADGTRTITAERITDGVTIAVTATMREGLATEATLSLDLPSLSGPHHIWTRYVLDAGHAMVARREAGASGGEASVERIEVPDTVILYPLMRCFLGPILVALARHGQPATLIVPRIDDPHDPQALRPQLSERRAWVEAAGQEIELDGVTSRADRYCFAGGAYTEEDARFWVGPGDMLLRYEVQQPAGLWRADLTQS